MHIGPVRSVHTFRGRAVIGAMTATSLMHLTHLGLGVLQRYRIIKPKRLVGEIVVSVEKRLEQAEATLEELLRVNVGLQNAPHLQVILLRQRTILHLRAGAIRAAVEGKIEVDNLAPD